MPAYSDVETWRINNINLHDVLMHKCVHLKSCRAMVGQHVHMLTFSSVLQLLLHLVVKHRNCNKL